MPIDIPGRIPRHLQTLFRAGAIGQLGDGPLLDRYIRERDEVAFEVLVARHGPMVMRVCRAALDDPNDVDDAFQAVFLVLIGRAESVRARDSVASWLFGVAGRVSARARADSIRRRRHERDAADRRPEADISAIDESRSDAAPDLHEELVRLPGRYREALVLCYFEGHTCDDAARRLGRPVGTIKARLSRARGILKRRLMRRGIALPAALAATEITAETAKASAMVPMALIRETLASASRFAAGAAIPSSRVSLLAEGAIAAMAYFQKLTVAGLMLAAVLTAGTWVVARTATVPPEKAEAKIEPAPAAPAGQRSGDGLPTIEGIVVMPDGSSAMGARIESRTDFGPTVSSRADAQGRFRIRGLFADGVVLQASTADASHQGLLRIASNDVRKRSALPLKLTLAPAIPHVVTVVAKGKPAEGAHVVATGPNYSVRGMTGRDGRVTLRLPEGGAGRIGKQILRIVAWHPEFGIQGVGDEDDRLLTQDDTRLSLLPTAPFTVRVVDTQGKGIAGLELKIGFQTEDSGWIPIYEIEAARVRTGPDGLAVVAWAPRDRLKSAEVSLDVDGSHWKIDRADESKLKARIVKVIVRRKYEVTGRIVMPAGASPEGLLISGHGFGPEHRGYIPVARARPDGSFTLHVPSGHGSVVGISDLEWACDPWSGVILDRDDGKPAEIVLKAYPATPLTVRVTRGADKAPVTDTWTGVSGRAEVKWVDANGKKHSASGGVWGWLKPDAQGFARTGVSRGKHEISMYADDWYETKTIDVTSDKPVEVLFHRAWNGERKVSGRLTLDGAPYQPSPELVARAWSEQRDLGLPLEHRPEVRPDGTFEVKFDAENLSVFFMDSVNRRGGFARLEQDKTDLIVKMEGTASYEGALIDDAGQPVADRTLQVFVGGSQYQAVPARKTDNAGRFRFPIVPANVPLRINHPNEEEGGDELFIFDRDRMFQPGEARTGERLTARRPDFSSRRPASSGSAKKPPSTPLAEGIENICRNARAAGMRGLILLQGDSSQNAVTVADRLLDYDEFSPVLGYLTQRLEPAQVKAESTVITGFGWPAPASGEIVLAALDGDRKTLAVERIAAKDLDAAVAAGKAFIERHGPPHHDARTLVAEARNRAKASGRRVWLVEGGPRCGPCFRLARWIDEHRATLEKDYVLIKVMPGIDDHVEEALAGLPRKLGDGVPWFAITEPDGKVLATSVGPLGNMGFPTSVEDLRHLRKMFEDTARKISPGEIDGLIGSLAPK